MPAHDQEPTQDSASLFDHEQLRNYAIFIRGALRRRRVPSFCVLAAIVTLAFVAVATLPKTFHVEAKILVQKNQVLALRGDAQDQAVATRGGVDGLLGRENLVAMIEETDLVHQFEAHRAPAQRLVDAWGRLRHGVPTEEEQTNALVEMLEKRLNVWMNEGTVTIAIDWSDAQMAKELVDSAEKNFLKMRRAQEVTAIEESMAIVQGHAATLRGDIDDAVKGLQTIRDARLPKALAPAQATEPSDTTAAPAAPPHVVSYARPAPPRATGPNPALGEMKATIDAKQRALDDLEDFRRRKLAEATAHLQELRATYTDSHPAVADAKQTMASLSSPSPQVGAMRAEIASLQAEYSAARNAEAAAHDDAPRGAVAYAPVARSGSATAVPQELPSEILRLDQSLRDDHDPATVYALGRLRDAMDKYAALRAQIQATQIDLETAKAAFKYRYQVITPAEVPTRPTKPNVALVLVAAFIAGLLAAIAVAVVLDVRAGRLVERWQIERLLDRPILGEIRLPPLERHEEA
jgi:uncharacterized protein involved in exopolysaccharide biosynthesis